MRAGLEGIRLKWDIADPYQFGCPVSALVFVDPVQRRASEDRHSRANTLERLNNRPFLRDQFEQIRMERIGLGSSVGQSRYASARAQLVEDRVSPDALCAASEGGCKPRRRASDIGAVEQSATDDLREVRGVSHSDGFAVALQSS